MEVDLFCGETDGESRACFILIRLGGKSGSPAAPGEEGAPPKGGEEPSWARFSTMPRCPGGTPPSARHAQGIVGTAALRVHTAADPGRSAADRYVALCVEEPRRGGRLAAGIGAELV